MKIYRKSDKGLKVGYSLNKPYYYNNNKTRMKLVHKIGSNINTFFLFSKSFGKYWGYPLGGGGGGFIIY